MVTGIGVGGKGRRIAAGLAPAPVRFVVRAVPQHDNYAEDGYRWSYVEYIAYAVGTDAILGRSTGGPHTAATFAEMYHEGAIEVTEAEAAALTEPRTYVFPRPSRRWYMRRHWLLAEGGYVPCGWQGFWVGDDGPPICDGWTEDNLRERVSMLHPHAVYGEWGAA